MNAYKSGITENNIRVLINLFIPVRAKTNMTRKNIINKLSAKYRCNVAIVLSIIDENNIAYTSATSAFYFEPIVYRVGQTIKLEFDENINNVSSKGIHFFIDKLMALNYNKPILEQKWPQKKNLYQDFYSNGRLKQRIKYTLENNEIYHKFLEVWYENGYRKYSINYILDKKNGIFNEWYSNGQFKLNCNYLNDTKYGIEKRYYDNGNKESYINYLDGVLHGTYKVWNDNGTIQENTIYYFGEEQIFNTILPNNRINYFLRYSSDLSKIDIPENEIISTQNSLTLNNPSKLRLISDINKNRTNYYSWNCS